MRFKQVIGSTKDIKKCGYKVIRKLHKLERKKDALSIYRKVCGDSYFVVIMVKNFNELLNEFAPNIDMRWDKFIKLSNTFANHIECCANSKCLINRTLLSDYLTSYTKFFNYLIENKYKIVFNYEQNIQWNKKSLMPYVVIWQNK